MSVWYCIQNGKQSGPLTLDAIREQCRCGQLKRSDHVWKEGDPAWKTVEQTELAALFPPAPPPTILAPEPPAMSQTPPPLPPDIAPAPTVTSEGAQKKSSASEYAGCLLGIVIFVVVVVLIPSGNVYVGVIVGGLCIAIASYLKKFGTKSKD